MSHQAYTPFIDDHVEDFDAADEYMTNSGLNCLLGNITVQEAEAQIAAVVLELQVKSTSWVLSVLPAVALDAAIGVAPSPGDEQEQKALLELRAYEATEALHNAAAQMGRDARRQLTEGLRVKMEDELAGVTP